MRNICVKATFFFHHEMTLFSGRSVFHTGIAGKRDQKIILSFIFHFSSKWSLHPSERKIIDKYFPLQQLMPFNFETKLPEIQRFYLYFFSRHGLRPFFGSHARTSHVQIYVRTHTCAHIQFKVVAHRTRTRTFYKFTFFFPQFFHNVLTIFKGSC